MIVFCHLFNDSSGSPRVLRSSIAALAILEGRNRLYVGSGGCGLLEEAGIEIRRFWYHRSSWRLVTLFTYLASQFALGWQLQSSRDIPRDATVYVNTLLPFGAALWARFTGRKVVYHLHEISVTPDPLRHFLVGIARRTADRLVYVSDTHRERLPIPGVAATVVANAIDQALYDRGATTPYVPRRSGRFEALMLASPRDYKGVPELLAVAQTFADRLDVTFTLVLNAEKDEVDSYLASRTVPPNVSVHARTHDPSGFYATADVVLNLSRVDGWVETFGLTVTEAMAFGIPVIAPPVGGPAEIVTDGIDGYLIDSRRHDALVNALRQLSEDPDLCLRLSAAARRRAADFEWSRFAKRLREEVAALHTRKS